MRIKENNCSVTFKWTKPVGSSSDKKFKYYLSIRNSKGEMVPAPFPCQETKATSCKLHMFELSLKTGDSIIASVKTCLENGKCLKSSKVNNPTVKMQRKPEKMMMPIWVN